jgi:hypothetical protein
MTKQKSFSILGMVFLISLSIWGVIACEASGSGGGSGGGSSPIAVTGIVADPTSLELDVGGTKELTAWVTPTNATNQALKWSTSAADKAFATVDEKNGTVTAVAVGTATITVTSDADPLMTATCVVKVVPPLLTEAIINVPEDLSGYITAYSLGGTEDNPVTIEFGGKIVTADLNLVRDAVGVAEPATYVIWDLSGVPAPLTAAAIGGAFYTGEGYTPSENRAKIKGVVLPDGLTDIGDHAFHACTNLTSIKFPDTIETIGGYALYGCTGLTSIDFPANLVSVGESAFDGCTGISSITLPASFTIIGGYAFNGCTALANISFPASLTTINNHAFDSCTGLLAITLPDSPITIAAVAFDDCDNLQTVVFEGDDVEINSDNSFPVGAEEDDIGLKAAYEAADDAGGAGTYTRSETGNADGSWSKQVASE